MVTVAMVKLPEPIVYFKTVVGLNAIAYTTTAALVGWLASWLDFNAQIL